MIDFFRSATVKLTASYLAIIMGLSIGFSVVLYHTSAAELGRQLPPRSLYVQQLLSPDEFNLFFQERITQARHHLLVRLILTNILVLIGAAALSYWLARRTLQPIEEAMAVQTRFSSDASHELRTPLTAIRTRNEVALRKTKLSSTEAKDIIKSNLEEVIKLEKLSAGLLRLSSTDAQAVVKKPLPLNRLTMEAIDQLHKTAQAKSIKVDNSVGKIKVLADADSLTQAIATILDNAIKYSPTKCTVWLESFARGGHGFLTIRDQGSGIAAADLPHIFDRFYRADDSRARQGAYGYGLGLAIAKQIVDQHGGEILVQSTLGQGSSFTVKLPMAKK